MEKNKPEEQTPEETMSLVDKAEQIAERIEQANEKTAQLIRKQEELKAEKILSGETEAGSEPVKKTPISDIEYSKKLFSGEAHIDDKI